MRRPSATVLPLILTLMIAGCGATPEASPAEAATSVPATPEPATPEPAGTDASEPTEEPTEAASDDAVEVVVGASSFAPGSLTVSVGTEVVFDNTSTFPHTITHGSNGRPVDDPAFDRPISEGATVRITFDEPGTYEITCKIHPVMNMTVVVEG